MTEQEEYMRATLNELVGAIYEELTKALRLPGGHLLDEPVRGCGGKFIGGFYVRPAAGSGAPVAIEVRTDGLHVGILGSRDLKKIEHEKPDGPARLVCEVQRLLS